VGNFYGKCLRQDGDDVDSAPPDHPGAGRDPDRSRYSAKLRAMLDHVGVQVADVEASLAFYLRTFAAVGIREFRRFPVGDSFVVGLAGSDGMPDFWLSPAAQSETRELHIAFRAADRATVDEVHHAAVGAGVEVLHAPREWPEYHPGYYGVFLRDLDGHNVEAAFHGQ
jgi:catechol 2,3-dioxygenase-like lactoylglutathione lyase family enzyme